MAHVLVVDDERNVRNTFALYMRSEGHEVRTAADAEEAMDLLRQAPVDVVVSDIILPGLSGIDLLQFVTEHYPDTRVILITGAPTVETASAAVRSRAHDYIPKPVRGEDLLRSVAAAADYKQLVDDNRRLVDENDRQRSELRRLLLSDRMAAVGTLAAGVSHEINNPLTYVSTNLELLEERLARDGADDDTACLLVEAREGVERVREIVAAMKAFSHSPDEERAVVDLRAVVESSIRLALVELRHRAHLVRSLQEVPPVLAHAARLGQVFINLLVNAAQAIPEGHRDEHEVRVEVAPYEGGVRVSVADTGSGIPAKFVGRVFDPFFTTKPTGVGTGLGLYICQSIIGAHGGNITVESTVGEGSTFHVWLPEAHTRQSAEALVAETPAEVPVTGLSVLVIDDEALIGNSVRRILRGHEVKVCLGGEEGIAALELQAYDVLLCDLIMPNVTGMDVYAWVRENRPAMLGRLVFMTGGAFTERARAFLAGITNTTLDKPFDLQLLRQVIHRAAQGG